LFKAGLYNLAQALPGCGAGADLDQQHPTHDAKGRIRAGAGAVLGDLWRTHASLSADEDRKALLDRARQAVIDLREV
jgi:hypothetical protein